MIQDIAPKRFFNSYQDKVLSSNAIALVYQNNEILLVNRDESWQLPLVSDLIGNYDLNQTNDVTKDEANVGLHDNEQSSSNERVFRFAFSIDGQNYFLIDVSKLRQEFNQLKTEEPQSGKFQFHNLQTLRTLRPMWIAFAGITGSQLSRFYEKATFCGRCGSKMIHSSMERAMTCPDCKNIVYPTISPAVIVAITKNDKILMTKYAGREYTNYALVAGFVEVGETLEQCVAREVKEEVGIEVTNIRYYKSQPWSFSDSLLAGFFAECNGSDEILLDTHELSVAEWIDRNQIPPRLNDISLTQEMIEAFRNHVF